MALGDSVVSIGNIALIALGENPVTSIFPPDNTKRAIVLSQRYDDVRRFVLRSHPWNCARKQAVLAASATTPPFQWDYAYPLPSDFIRMSEGLPENDRAVWEIVGNQLCTDEAPPLDLDYICDLQDPTLFDPGLVHAVAYAIVAELGLAITGSVAKVAKAQQTLDGKMATARLVGAQDNAPEEWDADIWLRSRYP